MDGLTVSSTELEPQLEPQLDTSKRKYVKQLFGNKLYLRILIFITYQWMINVMPEIILPAFGAKWAAGCDVYGDDDDCEYDYTTYNFYSTLFLSIRGLTSFLFSGFIGSLSDLIGRKPFLIIPNLLSMTRNMIIAFVPNLWIYWAFSSTGGIFRSSRSVSAVTTAYISDVILKDKLKTIAFSISNASLALSLIFGSALSFGISALWDVNIVWLSASVLYVPLLFYVVFIIKESRSVNLNDLNDTNNAYARSLTSFKCNNPFKLLLYINDNELILYIAIITVLKQTISVSISIVLIYINDQMNINDDGESTLMNMLVFVSGSIFGIISGGFVIPILKSKFKIKDITLIIIGIVLLISSQFILSIIAYITDDEGDNDAVELYCMIIIIVGSALMSGIVYSQSAVKSILSQYIDKNQQGLAFGILQSYQGIATIICPFAFGNLYNQSKVIQFPSLMFYVIAILLFIGLIITLFPLRKCIARLEKTGETYSFRKENQFNDDKSTLLKNGNKENSMIPAYASNDVDSSYNMSSSM